MDLSIDRVNSCSGFYFAIGAVSFFADFDGIIGFDVLELKDAPAEDTVALGNNIVAVAECFGVFVVFFVKAFHNNCPLSKGL